MSSNEEVTEVEAEVVATGETARRALENQKAIVPQDNEAGLIEPLVNAEKVVAMVAKFNELSHALLTADDIQQIGNKSFKKKSAWRKLNLAYGVSYTILDHGIEREGNVVTYAWFLVRASAPSGRFVDAFGACSNTEKGRGGGKKANHDVPAIAATRAKNRASSDLYGLGEVDADSLEGGETASQAEQSSPHARPATPSIDPDSPEARRKFKRPVWEKVWKKLEAEFGETDGLLENKAGTTELRQFCRDKIKVLNLTFGLTKIDEILAMENDAFSEAVKEKFLPAIAARIEEKAAKNMSPKSEVPDDLPF